VASGDVSNCLKDDRFVSLSLHELGHFERFDGFPGIRSEHNESSLLTQSLRFEVQEVGRTECSKFHVSRSFVGEMLKRVHEVVPGAGSDHVDTSGLRCDLASKSGDLIKIVDRSGQAVKE
jgi:hypothetical protein